MTTDVVEELAPPTEEEKVAEWRLRELLAARGPKDQRLSVDAASRLSVPSDHRDLHKMLVAFERGCSEQMLLEIYL